MKTVSGKVVSTKPVSLSRAGRILSAFVSSDNGASQAVSAYLRRASASFDELVQFHKQSKSKPSSNSNHKLKQHRHFVTKVEEAVKFEIEEERVVDGVRTKEKKEKRGGVEQKDEGNLGTEKKDLGGDREGNVERKKKEKRKGKSEGVERISGGTLGIEQKDVGAVYVESKKEKRKGKSEGVEREGDGDLGKEEEKKKKKKKKKKESGEVVAGVIDNLEEESGSKKKNKRRRIEDDS